MSSPPNSVPTSLSKLASKKKTKKKHFVQQKVKVLRASDPVQSVLMWGVNHSVGVFLTPSVNTSRLPASTHPAIFSLSICLLDHVQINDLSQVPVPVMLLPDDFRASTKIKVSNHLFNKYGDWCASKRTITLHFISLLASYPRLQTSFRKSDSLLH